MRGYYYSYNHVQGVKRRRINWGTYGWALLLILDLLIILAFFFKPQVFYWLFFELTS